VSITAPKGFEAAGIHCGIKPGDAPDLSLVATASRAPVAAAGVFTTNKAKAAPVLISQRHLTDGRAAAVVLNSGNANAATGEPGRDDARRTCALVAGGIGAEPTDVLVCSTGLIGYRLPMDAIESGVPKLVGALAAGDDAGRAAADAILTTDTVRKESVARATLPGGTQVTVGGMAKGAAMLAPSMATMLAVLTTDAVVEPDILQEHLAAAMDGSFHELIVDGCTSTNDTVVMLANGAAGNDPAVGTDAVAEAMTQVCADLAAQMAVDAEGATKHATVRVRGAATRGDARRAARQVATSQLVQCSLYGKDPYWGRVLSELGASGAEMDPEQVDIAYNGVVVCRNGVEALHDVEAAEAAMDAREIHIDCDLHEGDHHAQVMFTDLTHAYVDENMGTS
jgi:glutamate N-acetyltransferase / amino-acid N-acetyltransferase